MIYLDNAATTYPKPEAVYQAADTANRGAVNAGRGSYKSAREAAELISDTRDRLISLFHANGAECILTPSATIALNEIIGGLKLSKGDIVYVSPYEHNAVLRPLHLREEKDGITVKELPLCRDLSIDLDKTEYMFASEKPAAMFCSAISNVTGYLLPLKEIFSLSEKYGAVNVVDASQAAGLLPIDMVDLHAGIIVFAGHKTLYGTFGAAGFIKKPAVPLDVFLAGGTGSDSLNPEMPKDEPGRLEPASPALPAIAALNAALKEISVEEHYTKVRELTIYLSDRLRSIPSLTIYGDDNTRLGIVSFVAEGYKSSEIGEILDREGGIAVRTGYHCAGLIHKHLKDEPYAGTVRVSVGMFNTQDDIDSLVSLLNTL